MNLKVSISVLALSVAVLPQSVCSAESGQGLPPLDVVLKRVVERAEKEDENDRLFDQAYGYTRVKITEFRNVKGELKKNERNESRHDPHAVPPQPQSQRLATKLHSPKDTPQNPRTSDTDTRMRGRAVDRKDLRLDDDLLGRFTFTIVGRETVNGRSALVLEFEPKPRKLPERSLRDKFINKAAGRVWIDEEDYAVARADLHLTEKVNVVGGLVGAVWQFEYRFDRERTPDGLWFTRQVRWHLEGREVFVRRTVDYFEEKTDVCKVQ